MLHTLKRRGLFILTNFAIVVMISIIFWVLETYLGITISTGSNGGLLVFAALFGFAGAFINLLISKRMAKRAYKIQLLDDQTAMADPQLRIVYETVANIAQQEGIKMPEVGYYDSPTPNAFATGASRNNSLVAVSTGLLAAMPPQEVAAVVGHEMTHIMNGDMVTMTLLSGILNTFVIFFARVAARAIIAALGDNGRSVGSLVYFAIVFVLDIILSMFASIILMRYSRQREYRADAGAARYVGTQHMVDALRTLGSFHQKQSKKDAFAMMKIAGGKTRMNIFRSHPAIEKRIEALQTGEYITNQ